MYHEDDPHRGRRQHAGAPRAEETDEASERSGRWRRRKERILHTRISEDLAADLRRVAEDLRVPVSNLVRNVLEEAFSVVETVSDNVGELIEEVMGEAEAVRERIRARQRRQPGAAEQEAGGANAAPAAAQGSRASHDAMDDVIGWQALVLARPQRCGRCETLMGRGDAAYASVTSKGIGAAWVCESCLRA